MSQQGRNNNQNQPNMPRFNMGWLYAIILVGLIVFFLGGGSSALNSMGSVTQEATYTKFKEYVVRGYASHVEINKDESTLKMFVKARNVRDVFGMSAKQVGHDPYVSVEFGSVDEVEKFLTAQQKPARFLISAMTMKKETIFCQYL